MKIRHSPPGWDDTPIESTIDEYVQCYIEHPIDIADLLILLHSKNLITDDELLDLIGEPYAELVK